MTDDTILQLAAMVIGYGTVHAHLFKVRQALQAHEKRDEERFVKLEAVAAPVLAESWKAAK